MNDTRAPKAIEERLRRCEEQHEATFRDAAVAMAHVSSEGHWLRVNRRLAALIGVSGERLRGKPVEEFVYDDDRPFIVEAVSEMGARRALGFTQDARLVNKEGLPIWVSVQAVLFTKAATPFSSWIFVDIGERIADEERSRYLASVVDSSDDAIIGKTLEGIITSWNQGAQNIYGYTAEEMIGRPLSMLVPPDLKDELPAILARMRAGERVVHHETRRHRKDGTMVHLAITVSPVLNHRGKVVGASSVGRDISERKQAEERLRAAGAYNRRLLEAGLDPLVAIGADGTITDVNAATEKATGRPRGELIGTDFSNYFVDPEKARAGYQQVFRDGHVRDYPLEIRRTDGQVTPVLYNATIYRDEVGRVAGIFAAARDITERKQAEEALRSSEARLNKAQELAHMGSWELDLVSGLLVWSDEIYRIFEIEKSRFGASYEAFLNAVHPDDRAMVDFAYSNSLKQRMPYAIDHRLVMSDGRVKHVHEQCETVYTNEGVPLRSIGTVQDISERKRVEEALRESETRYRSLFERMFDGYAVHEITLDAEGRPNDYIFLEVNPAFERITGLKREQVLGRRAREVFPHQEPPWIETYGQVALKGVGLRFQQYAKAFDRYFEVAAFSPAPQQFATLFSDVTERRYAEQALSDLNRQLEQRVKDRTAALEAANRELESFAYSVSHDLRTPLRAVDGFSRILLREYEKRLDEEGNRLLRVVIENTEKMAQLISDILSFSRTGRAQMRAETVSMKQLAEEAWIEAIQDQGERRLTLQLGELPDVRGDRALLRQVFANLLGNAVKFTQPRSEAVVEVGADSSPAETTYYVKDNGVGFDMAYVDRLFGVFQRLHSAEEFGGTGVGLAIVKRIISRHGGRVWAESRLGEDTTFYFALPRE